MGAARSRQPLDSLRPATCRHERNPEHKDQAARIIRPFAPSILREAVSEWFEQDDDVPFMMEVFQIRPEKRALIPAVTHVDGSGRLQTVHKETNPHIIA